MVLKWKPVIDSFHKWLDAFTAYALVIVGSHPRQSLELFKYQQIISRAASKFQGTAFLAYDEHFRCQATNDLHILLPFQQIIRMQLASLPFPPRLPPLPIHRQFHRRLS